MKQPLTLISSVNLATFVASMVLVACSDQASVIKVNGGINATGEVPASRASIPTGEADLPFPMIPVNPIYDSSLPPSTPKPGKNYSVKVKIIEHGTSISDADLDRELKMVEKAYSQCDGVNFRVDFLGREEASQTTEEDHLISSSKGIMQMGDVFESFFSKFPNSPETGLISINIFDALDPEAREELQKGEQVSTIFEGQAYNAKNMDRIFQDVRSSEYRSKPLSEVGGNSIIIGWKTTQYDESQKIHMNDYTHKIGKGKFAVLEGWQNQSSALFAHEMGHVLMEKQDGTTPYKDHFCFDMNDFCPQGYLMSGGGFNDRIFLDPKDLKTPIGYTALPKIDTTQCEMLKQNPLVTAE